MYAAPLPAGCVKPERMTSMPESLGSTLRVRGESRRLIRAAEMPHDRS